MYKNEISNLASSKQKRFVSSDTIYWAKKKFKVNPLYLLNLSDDMFPENFESSELQEPQNYEYEIVL